MVLVCFSNVNHWRLALIKATEPGVPGERQVRAGLAGSISLAVIKIILVQWKPWRLPELCVRSRRDIVMPIEIYDLDNGIGVLIKGHGVVTNDEYSNTLKKHLTQDPDKIKKYRYSLSDYTEVTKAEVRTETIKIIANRCISASKVNPNIVHATVSSQDLIFGLSRMWEALSSETTWEIQVFKGKEEAKEWIEERVKAKWNITDLTWH